MPWQTLCARCVGQTSLSSQRARASCVAGHPSTKSMTCPLHGSSQHQRLSTLVHVGSTEIVIRCFVFFIITDCSDHRIARFHLPAFPFRTTAAAMDRSRRPWASHSRRDDKKRDNRDEFDDFLENKSASLQISKQMQIDCEPTGTSHAPRSTGCAPSCTAKMQRLGTWSKR